jgi:hypothetical protein
MAAAGISFSLSLALIWARLDRGYGDSAFISSTMPL